MKLPPEPGHNSAAPGLIVRYVSPTTLSALPRSPLKFSRADMRRVKRIVRRFKTPLPLVIDERGCVLIGELLWRASIELGLVEVAVIDVFGLTEPERDAMSVGYTRLLETGSFDREKLGTLLLQLEVEIPDLDFGDLGLEVAEIDLACAVASGAAEDVAPTGGPPTARLGDLFRAGRHRILAGDATSRLDMARLVNGRIIAMLFADLPYNLKIDGFVSKRGTKREFVAASGEMDADAFSAFLSNAMAVACEFSDPAALHFLCMDWRHMRELMDAAARHYHSLLNLCVWVKDRPGQGAWLRSQHELVFVYRVGKARQLNNVQLGRFGRSRTNVWNYPAAATFLKSDAQADLVGTHPTPKNKAMVADAILDCTKRGDIIGDTFLGSGTTLVACEDTARICYGMDLDPLYVDLSIRRWQAATGGQAVHDETGLTFDALTELRGKEVGHGG